MISSALTVIHLWIESLTFVRIGDMGLPNNNKNNNNNNNINNTNNEAQGSLTPVLLLQQGQHIPQKT